MIDQAVPSSPSIPRIWNISMNDLLGDFERSEIQVVEFADDTALVIGHKSKEEFRSKVKLALDLVEGWSERSGVRVNVDKCSYT